VTTTSTLSEYEPESVEEEKFLESYDPSKFPIVTVTVDVVALYRHEDKDWRVLLIERGNWPYKGRWALPGGFIDEYETASAAAARELTEETHMSVMDCDMWDLPAVTTPKRDPRGRVIALPFLWFLNDRSGAPPMIEAGDDAVKAKWFKLSEALKLELAFDHKDTLITAVALADHESGIRRNSRTMKRVK
jgi:8-oxo-dGTP diphosphatase